MAVSAVQTDTSSLLASLSASTGSSASGTKELSDRFLTLLVTQLKNQDPMNPMENAELTSQLAQLSTVEEIGKLNTSMTEFVTQYKAAQSLQAASLVGRQVLTEGDGLRLGASGGVGAVDLDGAADKVSVKIFDANGALARTLELGEQPAGLARFVWDGLDQSGNTLATGDYRFSVSAAKAGEAVTGTAFTLAQVLSVTLNDTGAEVEVSGEGTRQLSQIRQIY
jgi:flagellar basal-body rod modification protein FlgD